jgi:site-specific DNA-adenine methylase
MLGVLPPPPPGTQRILEPFLGSGAYSLSWLGVQPHLRAVGLDLDSRVVKLWKFLQQVDPELLRDLDAWWEEKKNTTPAPRVEQVQEIFGEGAALYFKINVCGVYTGQWSASQGYPQFSLPLQKTLEALEVSQRVEVFEADWKAVVDVLKPGDAVLLDPPYLGTSGNYLDEKMFDPSSIQEQVLSWGVPVLVTYGTGAPEIFPDLPWELVQIRKVPNIRRGGTVTREEWISRINWPREQDVLDMFSQV